MVNTRSQARSSIPVFMSKTGRNDRVSDFESECSIPDLLTREQIDELDNENLIHSEQHSDQMTIDQRFSSMNRQINELTGLVLALTEKLSSSHGEGNDQNTAIDKTSARSDNLVNTKQMETRSCHRLEYLPKSRYRYQFKLSNPPNMGIQNIKCFFLADKNGSFLQTMPPLKKYEMHFETSFSELARQLRKPLLINPRPKNKVLDLGQKFLSKVSDVVFETDLETKG